MPGANMPDDEVSNGDEEPLRVLVVEDDEDAGESMRRLLIRFGALVEVSNTAADALARVDRLRPELALVDLRLPDLHGFELVERLRVQLSGPTPLFVALSGLSNPIHDAPGRPPRFDRYLQKPIEATLLRELVDSTRRMRTRAARA